MTQTTDLSQDSESGHWLTHLMDPTYPNIQVLKNPTSSGGVSLAMADIMEYFSILLLNYHRLRLNKLYVTMETHQLDTFYMIMRSL